jgi:predicted transcriptional regulator
MDFDISSILENWDYKPGQVMVRKFKAADGHEVIQLRVDLGILQLNADGRPDGKRPMGHESWFDFQLSRLEEHRAQHAGTDEGFSLNLDDCNKLHVESVQYHHRYICLLQLEDFEGVIRDTERNLELFDFVEEFAEANDSSWSFQNFRPQCLMMQTRAIVSQKLKDDEHVSALDELEQGIEAIREYHREYSLVDQMDQSGEIASLEAWRNEIDSGRPMSPKEKLEKALQEAVKKEDYETAARVRDELRNLPVDPG